jgi:EAL domain-containing protein (putative c-di-GMP-specific phosphodiesterase class I)
MRPDAEASGFVPEPGLESPLAAAIAARDRGILDLVGEAVRRRDVVLAFQPVVQARATGKVAFYEGLIRVIDPEGAIVQAADFITQAETHELGRKLDCLALEAGLAALAESPDLRLSINMSARSLGYAPWSDALRHGLAQDPTAAERLILEISEASAMLMPDLVIPFMRGLHRQGITFALDDFGAGYTSLKNLREFTFDAIKIDGQFIRGIENNPDNQCLVQAMLAVAEQFDMFTVAEKVESAEAARLLAGIGVDCLQGYHFGLPVLREAKVELRRSGAGR